MLQFANKVSYPLLDELFSKARVTVVILSASVILLGWVQEACFYYSGGAVELSYLSLFDWPYSLANWLEPLLLAGAALLFSIAALITRYRAGQQSKRWMTLAWLFALLSFDEAVNAHDLILKPLRSSIGADQVAIWMFPAFLAAGLLCAYEAPILATLSKPYKLRFCLSAVLFISGAIVVECVSQYISSRFGVTSEAYRVAANIEETLEILGAALLSCTLLSYVRQLIPNEVLLVPCEAVMGWKNSGSG